MVRLGLGLVVLVFCGAFALAQDEEKKPAGGDAQKKFEKAVDDYRQNVLRKAEKEYRERFKKPETPAEFWVAMNFELRVGQLDLAADFLKGLLAAAKDPTKDLLPIADAEGLSAFLRLRNIRNWVNDPTVDPKVQDQMNKEAKANVEELIDRVTGAIRARLQDPEHIKRFIANLTSTETEVREYAIIQLRKSGAIVVPYMLDAMTQAREAADREAIRTAFLRLGADVVPPLLAALDINDPVLQADVIDTLRERADKPAVPFLWYLSASPKVPDYVRKKALGTIEYLLGVGKDQLPPAKVALTRQAKLYYQHRAKFPESGVVAVWKTDGKQFVLPPANLNVTQAEDYYGFKFARQALELDPAYEPAQVIFLSLALARAYQQTGLDKPLPREVTDLLKTINPSLVTATLDRALTEHRLPVILGAVAALGDLAEVRAVLPTKDGPPALIRALNYPDRRVQLAAADALLRIPPPPADLPRGRIVEVLRRAVASDNVPRVLVAQPNPDRDNAINMAIKEAGFEPVVVHTGREALQRLGQAADIDLLMVDAAVPFPELPYLLAQLRSDVFIGLLPVIVTAPPDRSNNIPVAEDQRLHRIIDRYRNVWLMPATVNPVVLKRALTARIIDATGQPLTKEERSAHARLAMIWLKQMATGEAKGYDVSRAQDAILDALRSNELALLAIEAAGRLPGRVPQRDLANVVLDKTRPAEIRSAAAAELVRHIQEHGVVLDKMQLRGLQDVYRTTDDPKLKPSVALLVGVMRPDATRTGTRLLEFTPPEAPAPAPEDKGAGGEEKDAPPKEK